MRGMQYIHCCQSPLGDLIMESNGQSLTGLWFSDQSCFDQEAVKGKENRTLAVFEETKKWLDLYFTGKQPDFLPQILLNGSEFRKAVWEILLTIPYGETVTYKEIADRIAQQKGLEKMSAQAVGGAVGHNPVAILVPCHRVVGAKGNLTGYGGGMDRKIKLLELEKHDMTQFFVPKMKK